MLYRSLYFLFHDENSARATIDELEEDLGLEDYQIHALTAQDQGLVEMPGATLRKKSPGAARLERILWYSTLAIFTVGLVAIGLSLLATSWLLLLFFAIVVTGVVLSILLFFNRVPSAQIAQFRDKLEQGDIVLMVDVPPKDALEVERFVGGRHPDARTDVSNWHIGLSGH